MVMQRIANPSTPVRFRPQPQFIFMENFQTECLILGGGVSGISIAARLSRNNDCILIEQNNALGQETSSRNSEVIHAGIYYKKNSLRSRLCIEGKEILYKYLNERKIDHLQCGKFILSSSKDESEKLHKIKENAAECGVKDLTFKNKAIFDYSFLSYKDYLYSPSTGIFDSHSYIRSLENDFTDNSGVVLLGNQVRSVSIENDAFNIEIADLNNKISFTIETKRLINCLGINAIKLSNTIHCKERHKLRLLKGEYYTYSGKEKLSHLIYPIPKEHSLGTHATIDLGKGIKFGPSAYDVDKVDYSISDHQKTLFIESIRSYWPSIDSDSLSPSYSGIRPLIENEDDFVIEATNFNENILVDVLGYSSPGLTSSLATASYVENLLSKF